MDSSELLFSTGNENDGANSPNNFNSYHNDDDSGRMSRRMSTTTFKMDGDDDDDDQADNVRSGGMKGMFKQAFQHKNNNKHWVEKCI